MTKSGGSVSSTGPQDGSLGLKCCRNNLFSCSGGHFLEVLTFLKTELPFADLKRSSTS